MGLDIVLYKKGKQADVTEIKESLHKALFANPTVLLDYEYVPKLSDYYRTDVWLNQVELSHLVHELKLLSEQLTEQQVDDLQDILKLLADPSVEQAHIAGD